MQNISTPEEIETASRKVIDSLYGAVSDFKINETFAIPEKGDRKGWDVQVNFMLDGEKYTVDIEIQEKNGLITSTRLIDTMIPHPQ